MKLLKKIELNIFVPPPKNELEALLWGQWAISQLETHHIWLAWSWFIRAVYLLWHNHLGHFG